jgi:hypothetical protein
MRGGTPETAFIGAVNGEAPRKENRIWHRGLIVFVREMVRVHALHSEHANWGLKPGTTARHPPYERAAVGFFHRHALPTQVNQNFHFRQRGCAEAAKNQGDDESAKQGV